MIKNCPVTGVRIKYFLLMVLVGFVFVSVYDYVLHAQLLMDAYLQTPQLWRAEEDMAHYAPYMHLFQFLSVLVTALIFTRNYENKGLGEGLRFGALIGSLMGVMMSASYAWMPISGTLALFWFAGGLVQGLGLGLIYALTYKDP